VVRSRAVRQLREARPELRVRRRAVVNARVVLVGLLVRVILATRRRRVRLRVVAPLRRPELIASS
jgi:hypothetical protein